MVPMPALAPAVPFRFAPLPRVYTELLARHNNKTRCVFCDTVPESAALCLTCGAVMCWRRPGCRVSGAGPCTAHAHMCGADGAAYLLLRASTTVLVHASGRRARVLAKDVDERSSVLLLRRRERLGRRQVRDRAHGQLIGLVIVHGAADRLLLVVGLIGRPRARRRAEGRLASREAAMPKRLR